MFGLFKDKKKNPTDRHGIPIIECNVPMPEVKPCKADQGNTECSLVEQLRNKQNELKELDKYNSYDIKLKLQILGSLLWNKYMSNNMILEFVNYRNMFSQDLYEKILLFISSGRTGILKEWSKDSSFYRNLYRPFEIQSVIDILNEYKICSEEYYNRDKQKKEIEEDIEKLKQQLGIE